MSASPSIPQGHSQKGDNNPNFYANSGPNPATTLSGDATSSPSLAAWQRLFNSYQLDSSKSKSTSNSNPNPSPSKRQNQQSTPFSSGSSPSPQPISRRQKSNNLIMLSTPSSSQQRAKESKPVRSDTEHDHAIKRIRSRVLTEGIPDDRFMTPSGSPYRPVVWKLLLSVRALPVAPYLSLVAKGKSPAHDKIKNDTFRTLATDQGFKRKVQEEKLIRLLDAFVWKHWNEDEQDSQGPDPYDFSYVQGMNVLAAPFLYTLPSEIEAFYCFSRFIEICCPLYVQPTLAGVHRGLQLLDRILEFAEPPLYAYLRSKNLSAEIYAFPSVLTLCACTPPLEEVLRLWDYLLACGAHLNIICVVAQLLLMREELMNSPSPMKLLRNFPPLDAGAVIGITTALALDLPESLYDDLVRHTYDPVSY